MPAAITPIEPTEDNCNTIVELPKGRGFAVIKPRSADVLFTYQEKVQKLGLAAASTWLLIESVLINGEPLTIENLDEKIRFSDRARLDAATSLIDDSAIVCHDGLPLTESEDFTIADGRRIQVLDPPSVIYDQFLKLQIESSGKAFRYACKHSFSIDGLAITDEMLALHAPQGVGYELASMMIARLSALFQMPQAHKI